MSSEHEPTEFPERLISASAEDAAEGLVPADAPGSEVDLRDSVPLGIGAVTGLAVSALDIAVWWAVDSASSGWMLSAVVWGVPTAVFLLIVCGAVTRRFRLWLVVVGGFLFASPWIGLGVSLLLR